MAVSTVLNEQHTKATEVIKNSQSRVAESNIGYTDRGTQIVSSNTEMGKNSFLQLLVAQLKNMDPSKDQDSTAYITQMAEFASIEQLNNLNTSISDFANQQKVGQVAIIDEVDSNGYNKWGIITQIVKSGTTTYATVQDTATGELHTYDIKKVIGTSDSGYSSANFETAINSKFLSASQLAGSNADAVIIEKTEVQVKDKDGNFIKDKDGKYETEIKTEAFKCTITGAYLDKQNNKVIVTVKFKDAEGKEVEKDYNYDNIAIAGKLTNEVMDTVINNAKTNTAAKSKTSVLTPPNLKAEDTKAEEDNYAHPGIPKKEEDNNDSTVDATKKAKEEAKKAQDSINKAKEIAKENNILNKYVGN